MENYKEYIQSLAHQIMIDLNDEEIEDLKLDFKLIGSVCELMNEINTEDVEEMVYPFENATKYLREDKVDNVLTREDALKNAPKVVENQIVVPKVVK